MRAKAGGSNAAPLMQTVQAESISPWVKVQFTAGGTYITVGNESSPEFGHNAVIESFEYGNSDGQVCNIEISDQQGGEFNKFVDNIAKCIKSDDVRTQVTWGWTVSNCDGSPGKKIQSPILYVTPIKIDVSFAEGKIKYVFSCADLMQMVFVSRPDKVYGSDDQKMPLQEAIKALFNDTDPKITAKFLRVSPDGKSPPTEWTKFNKPDVVGKWPVDNQNKLSCAMKWLEPFMTDKGKGIHPTWSPTEKNTVIFWEDAAPDCENGAPPESIQPLGTFIVNGGNCSNVISFNPKISWIPALAKLSRGGSTSPMTGKPQEKSQKCNVQLGGEDNKDNTAGIQRAIPPTGAAIDNYGKEAGYYTDKSQNANAKAASYHVEGLAAIEADLVIQGDPSDYFCDIQRMIYKTVAIVVINPFHLAGGSFCGDWLAKPGCNNVMSNKNWLIKGVSHSIRIGSYTTTLKITLIAPGIDIKEGETLGGGNSGGYVPPGTC